MIVSNPSPLSSAPGPHPPVSHQAKLIRLEHIFWKKDGKFIRCELGQHYQTHWGTRSNHDKPLHRWLDMLLLIGQLLHDANSRIGCDLIVVQSIRPCVNTICSRNIMDAFAEGVFGHDPPCLGPWRARGAKPEMQFLGHKKNSVLCLHFKVCLSTGHIFPRFAWLYVWFDTKSKAWHFQTSVVDAVDPAVCNACLWTSAAGTQHPEI